MMQVSTTAIIVRKWRMKMNFKAVNVSPMEKVFPTAAPSEEGAREKLSGLRGEIVSFQLAYYAESQGFARAEAEVVSPIRANVKLRKVALVPCEYPCGPIVDEDYLTTAPGLYPDRLEVLEKVSDEEKDVYKDVPLIHGQWRSLWIDVEIPEDMEAGEYPVTIRLIHKGEVLTEKNVSLEVIGAVLPAMKVPHTEWFHSDCLANYYGEEVFSEEYWRIVENFVKTAVKHRYNMLLTPIFTPPLDTAVGGERRTVQLVDVTVQADGSYAFGFEKLDRWVEMGKRCGIRFFELSHLFTQWGATAAPKIMAEKDGTCQQIFGWDTDASGEEYRTFLHAFLTALKLELAKLGIEKETYFHVSDEPSMEQIDSYRDAKKAVEKDLEGYGMFDALSDYGFYEQGLVQQPVCGLNHIAPFLKARAEGKGPEKLWGYYCVGQPEKVTNRFIVQPGYRTRVLGAQMYKYELAGFLQWGYNFYNSAFSLHPIDPYRCTDADGAFPSGDPFIVYPGKDGAPEESQRLMLMDEAMSDLCAMNLLEGLCGREAVLACLEPDGEEILTIEEYPRNREYLTAVRERVNRKIAENM